MNKDNHLNSRDMQFFAILAPDACRARPARRMVSKVGFPGARGPQIARMPHRAPPPRARWRLDDRLPFRAVVRAAQARTNWWPGRRQTSRRISRTLRVARTCEAVRE